MRFITGFPPNRIPSRACAAFDIVVRSVIVRPRRSGGSASGAFQRREHFQPGDEQKHEFFARVELDPSIPDFLGN